MWRGEAGRSNWEDTVLSKRFAFRSNYLVTRRNPEASWPPFILTARRRGNHSSKGEVGGDGLVSMEVIAQTDSLMSLVRRCIAATRPRMPSGSQRQRNYLDQGKRS
jgi:hypothetical protein